MIKNIKGLDVAAKIQATLGEGPAWNTKLAVLHCVDILGKKVYTHNPELGTIDHFSTEMSPGAVLPTTANKLAIALNDGLYLADLDGKNLEKKFSIEPEILGNRMNDAKCDPNGVIFGGTMGDGNSPTGSLYRIDSHGVTKVLKDVTVSNGLAWNPDGSKMYYIDSGKNRFKFQILTQLLLRLLVSKTLLNFQIHSVSQMECVPIRKVEFGSLSSVDSR